MTNPTVTFHPILDTYDGSTPPPVQEGYPTINLGGGAGPLESTLSSAPLYGHRILGGGKRKYRKSKKSKSKKSKSKTKKSKSKRKTRLSKKTKRSKNRRSKKSRRSKKKRR